jgi:SAM-dependent methyltransferase
VTTSHDQEVTDFWNKCFYELKLPLAAGSGTSFAPILVRLHHDHVHRVLDLGSGYGRWSIPLAQAGFAVTAVDISTEAIRLLKQWAEQLGLHIETNVSSAQDLALDDQFDAVFCNSVLDHMTYADAVTASERILQSLKIGGTAYLSFDGIDDSDKTEYESFDDGTRLYSTGHRKGMLWRFFTDDEIRALLKSFRILQFETRLNGARELWVSKESS